MLRFDEKWNMNCAIESVQYFDKKGAFSSTSQSCLVLLGPDKDKDFTKFIVTSYLSQSAEYKNRQAFSEFPVVII